MSGWSMDPNRRPMEHRAKGRKFQQKYAATIKAAKTDNKKGDTK